MRRCGRKPDFRRSAVIKIEAGRGLALSIIASRIERTAPREPLGGVREAYRQGRYFKWRRRRYVEVSMSKVLMAGMSALIVSVLFGTQVLDRIV